MTIRQSMAEGKLTTQLTDIANRAMCGWMDVPGMQESVPWISAGLATTPVPALKALSVGLFALQAGCNFANENVPGGPQVEGTYQTGCDCRVNVRWYEPAQGINPVWGRDFEQFTLLGIETRTFHTDDDRDLVANTLVYSGIDAGEECVATPPTVRVDFGPMPREDLSGARLTLASSCQDDPDGPIPDNPGPPPDLPPFTGTTIDNSCNVTATLLAFIPGSGNSAIPVIKMTNDGPAGGLRAPGGGVIGGCNWDGDMIFVGGDGEGPPTIGPPPPDGIDLPPEDGPMPDWLNDFLRTLGADIVGDILEDVLAPEVDAGEWFMQAPCDIDPESGEPAELIRQFPKAKLDIATYQRINAIPEFLGQHLAWKTPICHETPAREGDWITIEFQSDEISPMGNTRLLKLFRYRSKSGRELGELIDYWRDFTWSAGPVCVIHSGAWWGTPQSWARDANEGKRLILHAAAEAGIDPNQVGKWQVSGSNNPRYGMPGTMRMRINKGTYCITNRLGSDGRPTVGIVPQDP